MMGSYRRRGYNECMCKWCGPSGTRWRKFVKDYSVRVDRLQGKRDIAEQLEDLRFGIDPDEYGLGNWVYL